MGSLGRDENKVPTFVVDRSATDSGLVASGSIVFAAGDDLTTEKKTAAISPTGTYQHPDALYCLIIDKPTENTAGNLTITTYNQVTVDGTNERDVTHTTHTVEVITGAGTYRGFLVQGLFIGNATIKLGAKFATDSGAITVYYKLYRL